LILQRVSELNQDSSCLPHIIASAPLSVVDLWSMIALSPWVFFVIVDYHFVAIGPLCIGSLLDFCWLFTFVLLWVVSMGVLICLVLLMDGFPSLIFIYMVFLLLQNFSLSSINKSSTAINSCSYLCHDVVTCHQHKHQFSQSSQ
jgi:hypothetical protein